MTKKLPKFVKINFDADKVHKCPDKYLPTHDNWEYATRRIWNREKETHFLFIDPHFLASNISSLQQFFPLSFVPLQKGLFICNSRF